MSYLSRPTLVGRAPRLGRGMGDIVSAPSSSKVEQLQRQVNRFTLDGGAPVHLRASAHPVQVTGHLDPDTATMAVWIMQMRAGAAHIAWNDGASADLLSEAMGAWKDPAAFVIKHLDRVTQTIRLYGDKNKIPPAKGLMGMTPSMIAGVITVSALVIIWRKR